MLFMLYKTLTFCFNVFGMISHFRKKVLFMNRTYHTTDDRNLSWLCVEFH
ncbi:hypothetical protein HanPSC8_Chr06g0252351 [Helianthus annuus]|nr:hypothetical protein HanPSC8_Chr06g0252351 [Helianthus annuus]